MTTILVLFHSPTRHIERMATEEAEGARQIERCTVAIQRVRESRYEKAIQSLSGGGPADAEEASPDELGDYDAIIFGPPTRFGNMTGQMRQFLNQTGDLWMRGALVG